MGPFDGYAPNREPMLDVIGKHRAAAHKIDPSLRAARSAERGAARRGTTRYALGETQGFRNSQATVLAPTGTIAFMMDCDTTGVEPDIALVKYKKLVGGGMLKIVNNTVPRALQRLGYESKEMQDDRRVHRGARHHRRRAASEGRAPAGLRLRLQAGSEGARSIHHLGHLRMMGAVQPFISGAISKTINMPTDATVDDIIEAYIEAWRWA